MSDAILRRIRPEQFREVILLVVTVGLLLFFASQIPNYFDPRSVNRLTTGLAITAGRRGRAGAGRADPQHRPVGLLDGRADGLRGRHAADAITRTCRRWWRCSLAMADRVSVLGAINGLIVAYGGVPAIIATLGTLALYRVVLVEFSGAKTVTTADLPDWLNDVPSATVALGRAATTCG